MEEIIVRCRGIIEHEGKILLVKHPGKDFYTFPGGHLDYGEDPEECIVREIEEELGIHATINRLAYVHTFTRETGQQYIEFFFRMNDGALFLLHEEKEKSHAYEIEEVVWATPEDVYPIFPHALGKIFKEGELLTHERVIFVRG